MARRIGDLPPSSIDRALSARDRIFYAAQRGTGGSRRIGEPPLPLGLERRIGRRGQPPLPGPDEEVVDLGSEGARLVERDGWSNQP